MNKDTYLAEDENWTAIVQVQCLEGQGINSSSMLVIPMIKVVFPIKEMITNQGGRPGFFVDVGSATLVKLVFESMDDAVRMRNFILVRIDAFYQAQE